MSMSIQDFEQLLTKALKEHSPVEVSTLRLLISRLKNEQIANAGELSNETVLKIIQSEFKKRKEAESEYARGGRTDLANKENEEALVLAKYLPQQLSESEILIAIEQGIAVHNWTGSEFGVAMKILKEQLGATVDGALLARLLKEKLNT